MGSGALKAGKGYARAQAAFRPVGKGERAVIEQAEQSVNLKHVPDGGLIPSENQDLPVPTAPVATTTASSTLASATSTATTTEGIVPIEDILVPSDTQE